MTRRPTTQADTASLPTHPRRFAPHLLALLCSTLAMAGGAQATTPLTVSPSQNATAEQVARSGVPLEDLAPNAPEQHTVQSGDTLWSLATLFLRSPWRWPELWGMNRQDIRNPHRIYPGQVLRLVRKDGRATLSSVNTGTGTLDAAVAALPVVHLSPRVRSTAQDRALVALPARSIEPFLTESLIVDDSVLNHAPRLVATQENRVLLTRGDRAYARGPVDAPLSTASGQPRDYSVFRPALALRDPQTGELLGHEAQYVGKALLVRPETEQTRDLPNGKVQIEQVPATLDIVAARQEMRVGDRLLPEAAHDFTRYVPHAPQQAIDGRIVAVHGSAVANAAQNQVVIINRGQQDGLETGHVLAILKDGVRLPDKTDALQPLLKLPDERNGLLMVFRTFERLSYGLVLQITDGVRVGDRLATPR